MRYIDQRIYDDEKIPPLEYLKEALRPLLRNYKMEIVEKRLQFCEGKDRNATSVGMSSNNETESEWPVLRISKGGIFGFGEKKFYIGVTYSSRRTDTRGSAALKKETKEPYCFMVVDDVTASRTQILIDDYGQIIEKILEYFEDSTVI